MAEVVLVVDSIEGSIRDPGDREGRENASAKLQIRSNSMMPSGANRAMLSRTKA
jgi:hypothetical protein